MVVGPRPRTVRIIRCEPCRLQFIHRGFSSVFAVFISLWCQAVDSRCSPSVQTHSDVIIGISPRWKSSLMYLQVKSLGTCSYTGNVDNSSWFSDRWREQQKFCTRSAIFRWTLETWDTPKRFEVQEVHGGSDRKAVAKSRWKAAE